MPDQPIRCKRCGILLSRQEIQQTNGKYCYPHAVVVYKYSIRQLLQENEELKSKLGGHHE